MLVENLVEDLPLLAPTGNTLSVEEKMNLELALLKIHQNQDFEEVFFWGRVRGIQKDYYVAQALNYSGRYEFPTKRYFWASSSNWTFAQLPQISVQPEQAQQFNGYFSGQHDRVLISAQAQQAQALDDESLDDFQNIQTKDFTELGRLSFVVRAIDQDCALVPLGSFRMTPAHELARNKSFSGLNRQEIGSIENYAHFRPVQLPDKREQLDRDDALYTKDFLDPIARDQPKGSWSIKIDRSGSLATVTSYLWPGYFGYHKASTARFGGVYLGDGIHNSDLAFMI